MICKTSISTLLALAFLLTGCGDSGDDQETKTAETTPGPTTPREVSKDQGGALDKPEPTDPKPPPTPQELPPLVYSPALPTDPVAWVNGKEVPANELLELILDQNFTQGVQALLMSKVALMELKKEKLELTEEAIEEEVAAMLERSSPGTTVEDVKQGKSLSWKHLRKTAVGQRAWKELFWRSQNIPEDQRHRQTNQMLMQFFLRQRTGSYVNKIRGSNPGPIPGLAAQVTNSTTGEEVYISASEALDFLLGLSKLGSMTLALNELVDRKLIDHALSAAGASVFDSEVLGWAATQRTKHQPPFTWEALCRLKGKTTEQEMERWRRIQAYQRASGYAPAEADVMAFLEKHKNFFLGETKRFSHILISTTDEKTQLPSPEKEKAAKVTISTIHEKLREGLDFGWMAETYSQDPVTSIGKGRIGQTFKEWGGSLDPSFHKAAWRLETIGELSKPVKSQFGWHVIRLDEINAPGKKEPNWKDPNYWTWVEDEFLTQQMGTWLDGLRAASKVKKVEHEALRTLKERSYWSDPADTETKSDDEPKKDDSPKKKDR